MLLESLSEEYKMLSNLIKNMVFVQGGTKKIVFKDPKHNHDISVKDYYICKFPVRQSEWKIIMKENPPEWEELLKTNPCWLQDDDLPIVFVSWSQCMSFCEILKEKTNLKFSLPSTEQWEFASIGGNLSKGYLYSGSNNLDEVAWYNHNANKLMPVGLKKSNELGLYDMHGNIWEWCYNWKIYGRARAGGSWYHSKYMMHDIHDRSENFTDCILGFRLVINL